MALRGGIVGCGYFAQFQIEAWRRMPDVELVAAADPDLERAKLAAPRAFESADEMLERVELDFIDIATRPEHHLSLAVLAASRKIHAICQKPMAPTWQECLAMAFAAETAGIRLMIHENWRWQPWYRICKDLIGRGDIGRPVGYSFRTRRRDGIGPKPFPSQPYFASYPRLLIYETLVHHIDTARYLFGDVQSVFAHARRHNPALAGEDHVLLTMIHEDESCGVIDGHRILDTDPPNGPAMGEARLEGDEGALSVRASGDVYRDDTLLWKNDVAEGYRGDSVRATQQHFVDCLLSGAPFETNPEEYLKTVRVVEAAYESLASRQLTSV